MSDEHIDQTGTGSGSRTPPDREGQLHISILEGLIAAMRHVVDTVPAAAGLRGLVARLEGQHAELAAIVTPPPEPAPEPEPEPQTDPDPPAESPDPAPADDPNAGQQWPQDPPQQDHS